MIDLDGITLPSGFNVVADPAKCVRWAIAELLPPEFYDASFIYQLSSSAGLTKADDELSVHLWLFTERPYWDEQFRDWVDAVDVADRYPGVMQFGITANVKSGELASFMRRISFGVMNATASGSIWSRT